MIPPVRITMLIAGLGLTGTPIKMMDVLENINLRQFDVVVAYKPDYPSSELDFLEDLKNLGITTVPLRGKSLFSLKGLFDLYKHIKTEGSQIVHCWDSLEIVARILKLVTGCRVIMSYCNPLVDKGSFLYYIVNKATSFLTDGIIFCSKAIKQNYESQKVLYFKKTKIKIIFNCINIAKIKKKSYDIKKIKKRYKIHNRCIVLTNIGYFNVQKGQIYLIETMKKILESGSKVKLILVGWGPLENFLREKAQELGILDNIVFAGKCQRDVVLEILSITDIFILSSLWEGFGRVMGEAMAMGKPVVATRTDGSELLVEHDKTGLLVPSKNPQALADSVLELIKNPRRRRRMGEAGEKKVASLLSPQTFISAHETFYRMIVQEK